MKEIQCLLIRHGKTNGNTEKRYTGSRTDEPLCEAGISELIIRGILSEKYEVCSEVYVSPLRRCTETAAILLPDCRQICVDELKEIDFGDFEGLNYEELKDNADYQRWIDSGGTIPFPGGESVEDFIRRSVGAFRQILSGGAQKERNGADGCIIPFVIHGGSIMAIMSELTGENYFDFQVNCGEGYLIKCMMEEEHIDVISYNRICNGCDS